MIQVNKQNQNIFVYIYIYIYMNIIYIYKMYRIRPQEMQDMCKMIPCSSAFMVTLWYTRQPSAPGHCLYPEFLPRVDVTDVSHLEKLRKTEDFVPKWLDAPWFNMKFSGWMWNDILWRHRLDGISLKLSFEHKHVYIEKSVLDLELSTWMDKYPTILILVQVKSRGCLLNRSSHLVTSQAPPRWSWAQPNAQLEPKQVTEDYGNGKRSFKLVQICSFTRIFGMCPPAIEP